MKKLIYSQEDLDLILSIETEEKDEEIERLNNIINEFEEWLNAKYEERHDIWYVKVLIKLKELKGSDKEW